MTYVPVYSSLIGLVQLVVPYYALRLNRLFGTKKVGWPLFVAFVILGLLHLVKAWQPLGFNPAFVLEMIYIIIPVLLLIGMAHIETLFKERLRVEAEEKRMRSELEVLVGERTAELAKANEELKREMARREQDKETLRKSEEQYRLLFIEHPQPMWVHDLRSFRFLVVNKAALRHYGFTRDEFMSMTARDLCPPGDVTAFIADARKGCLGIQPRGIWRHCRKDKAIIEVEITAYNLMYANSPARLVLVNDITEEREQLRQALSVQRARLLSRVAGGAGHKVLAAATTISECASSLKKGQESPGLEPLKQLTAAADSAADLGQRLLAVAGQHPSAAKPLGLNQFIKKQAKAINRLLADNISLEKECAADLPGILIDPSLLERMLHELVANACKAMPKGGTLTLATSAVKVDEAHVRRRPEARVGEFVTLAVSDTGCGMSPEVQAQLFEPFISAAEGDAEGRTSLGLATVQGLVSQYSGWIEVSSRVGAGSRFTLFFPVPAAEQSPKAAA